MLLQESLAGRNLRLPLKLRSVLIRYLFRANPFENSLASCLISFQRCLGYYILQGLLREILEVESVLIRILAPYRPLQNQRFEHIVVRPDNLSHFFSLDCLHSLISAELQCLVFNLPSLCPVQSGLTVCTDLEPLILVLHFKVSSRDNIVR